MSKSRKRMPKGKSKRLFTKTASKTHIKNVQPTPQRGGFRL